MKPLKFQRPWLLSVRGIALVAMGLVAIIQHPNSMQPLLLIFALLYGFNLFLTLIETLALKREKLSGYILVGAILNAGLMVLLLSAFLRYESPAYAIEQARSYGLYMIFLTLFIAFITDIVEYAALLKAKVRFSGIYLINTILTLMIGVFFYSFIKGVDQVSLRLFGFMAIGTGLIFFIISSFLSDIRKQIIAQDLD